MEEQCKECAHLSFEPYKPFCGVYKDSNVGAKLEVTLESKCVTGRFKKLDTDA